MKAIPQSDTVEEVDNQAATPVSEDELEVDNQATTPVSETSWNTPDTNQPRTPIEAEQSSSSSSSQPTTPLTTIVDNTGCRRRLLFIRKRLFSEVDSSDED